MFHRRLALLAAAMLLCASVLGAQLLRLTVIEGERWLEEAESALSTVRLLDTIRGRILDRKGRELAVDQPCFDIAVDYDVIAGDWVYRQARRQAYREHSDAWIRMGHRRREDLIGEYYQPTYQQQVEGLWETVCRLGGIDRAELDRRRETIIERVQRVRASHWRRLANRRAEESEDPVELADIAEPVREERTSHALLSAVSNEVAYAFRKLRAEAEERPELLAFRKIEVVEAKTRAYPHRETTVTLDRSTLPAPLRTEKPMALDVAGVAGSLIGSMRDEVWAEDEQRLPYRRNGVVDLKGYLPGDHVGSTGIEASEELRLRGRRGRVIRRLDTGQETIHSPEVGEDVRLTLDIALQARVRGLLDPQFGLAQVQPDWHRTSLPAGTPLYGAVVVMEVDSGDLLALVSTPTLDGLPDEAPDELTDQALVNKAIGGVYPPGSTMKPIIYTIAATERAMQWDQVWECKGHLLPHRKDVYRCWIYRPRYGYATHGRLGPSEAIARSCNIYFYESARSLGAARLVEGLRRWGYGRQIGLGIDGEVSGMLPSLTGVNPEGRELSLSNAIMMGIGQGPSDVPPVQVAAGHAALARGGYYQSPVLIEHRRNTQDTRDLSVSPRVIANALQGMYESANNADYGTGHHISGLPRTPDSPKGEPILNIDRVTCRAKTGTAQTARPRWIDANDNGEIEDGERITSEHGWYVVHAQRPDDARASYVVVVLMEYGGSGGRVSGPIANQVLHALRAEGYL